MSAQYPIQNQNQQVSNQQGPEYIVGEQQGQDLNDGSSDQSSPDVVDHYSDPHSGSIVIVRSLDLDQASVVDTTKRRPALFRMGPFFPTFFRRTSTESPPGEVVDLGAQVSEKTEATVTPTVPSPDQRKSRRPSFINVTWFRKKSKDNVVLEGVEEKEIPRAKHVENVKALYEEQEQTRAALIRGVGFTKPL
jgi:hypothetical protein